MIREIVIFFVLSGFLLGAVDVGELEKKLETASPTEQCDILFQLAENTALASPEKSIGYASRALHLARQSKNKIKEGLALQILGAGHMYAFRYQKALDYFSQAQRIFEPLEDKKYLAVLWRLKGSTYLEMNDFKQAVSYFDRGLEYFKKTGDQREIALLINTKGIVCVRWGKMDEALAYFHEAVKICETPGSNTTVCSKATYFLNLGHTYRILGDYDKALHYLKRSLSGFKKTTLTGYYAYTLVNIARVYRDQGNFSAAADYCNRSLALLDNSPKERGDALILLADIHIAQKQFQKALDRVRRASEIYKQTGSKYGMAISYTKTGRIYKLMRQYPEALKNLEQGVEIAKQLNLPDTLQECYLYYSEIYSALGDSAQSLKYYKMHDEAKEKIFNKAAASKIMNTHAKYETENLQKEIEGAKTSKQTVTRYFLAAVLLFGLVLTLTLFNRQRIKKRAQLLLEQKNREIIFQKKKTSRLSKQLKEYLSRDNKEKYESSNLTPHEEERYLKKIIQCMEDKKPHLDSQLTVKQLAAALAIPHRELSQVINKRTCMHFYDFINRYRVEEAKILLEESVSRQEMTILDVAYDSGFNSKSSFNSAFKKTTGVTPSQYKKACLRSTARTSG